jgi:CBS domain-containing protein
MMNEPLHTIMSSEVLTISPEQSLAEVRDIFLTKRIHHLPVVDGKKLVGLVTTWDLFRLGLSSEAYASTFVSQIMTRKLATLEPHESIGAAAEVFMEHLFHAIPIVNDDRELLGILTTYDLLKYEFFKEYSEDRKQAEMLTGWH